MASTWLKSIGAVLAGLAFIGLTHTGVDFVLQNTGVLPKDNLFVGAGLIWMVIGYRTILSIAGCYLTAALAPHNPMAHALTLGGIGAVLSSIGAVLGADLGPAWYAWTLAASSLPISYVAGVLHRRAAAS